MIHVFSTTRGANDTFHPYLKDWAGDLAPKIRLHVYEKLLNEPEPTPGTYIFTDIDRLTNAQMEIVCAYADELARYLPNCKILNHPSLVMNRLDLLRMLHKVGINQFNIYPIDQIPQNARYPIFLRNPNEHFGPFTDLLYNRKSVQTAYWKLLMMGINTKNIVAIEYCNTKSQDGWFRKYSAFRFAETILPAHVIFGKEWVTKDSYKQPDKKMLDEKLTFIRTNPHSEQLKTIFETAHIDYGRIDYGLVDGEPKVWEINTNPILIKTRASYRTRVLEIKEELAVTIKSAFLAIDSDGYPPLKTFQLRFPRSLNIGNKLK